MVGYRITYLDEEQVEQTVLCENEKVADMLAKYLANLPCTENVVVFDGHHGKRYHRKER